MASGGRGWQAWPRRLHHVPEDGTAAGLNLHGFYAGVERIFEDIARTSEGAVPAGATWHQDLLMQMSAEVAGIRPAVVAQETRQRLDDLRGFRHLIRNAYTLNLRPARVRELTAELHQCYQNVERDLGNFASFLEGLSQDDK